jgi:predicted NBD/HSP70 family sugar kinase
VPLRTGRKDLIRDLNRTLVLNMVREREGLSRASLARLSGLSPSTVTAITASLLEDGYLLEDEQATGSSSGKGPIGRPATMLRVDPAAGHAVGIKVTADNLTAAVTDLAAAPLGIATVPRRHEDDPTAVGDLFETVILNALEAAGVPRERLVGIGVGVPGIVDPETRRVADSPLLEWAHLDLVELLEERLALPVLVDNDVNTLTVAQLLFGAGRGISHFLVVTIGRGIGMGVVVNGLVHRGSRGGAGEIGHVQAVPNGPDCWCGRRGCLEAVAAEPALVREILASTGRLTQPADIAALAARDSDVAGMLGRAGRHVGHAVASITTVLDPQRVVISGEGVRLGERYLAPMRAELSEREQKEVPTEIVIEPWGDEAWARGAATLVLRELFHPAHLRDEVVPAPARIGRVRTGATKAARLGRGGRR